jgi:hypothetical protein
VKKSKRDSQVSQKFILFCIPIFLITAKQRNGEMFSKNN